VSRRKRYLAARACSALLVLRAMRDGVNGEGYAFCTPTLRISLATWALTVRSSMPRTEPILFVWSGPRPASPELPFRDL